MKSIKFILALILLFLFAGNQHVDAQALKKSKDKIEKMKKEKEAKEVVKGPPVDERDDDDNDYDDDNDDDDYVRKTKSLKRT